MGQSPPSIPQGYKGAAAAEGLQVVGVLIGLLAIVAAVVVAVETKDGWAGLAGGAAGILQALIVWSVGAILEHAVAIRAHLDGSTPLTPPSGTGFVSTPPMDLFDVRLVDAGARPERIARELRNVAPRERVAELMAHLPAIVAENVGYATAKGLEVALTNKGATVDVVARPPGRPD